MKLKLKQSILRNGKRLNEGEILELENKIAKVWIKKGLAKKVNKSKFETKELKTEILEIKNDATN